MTPSELELYGPLSNEKTDPQKIAQDGKNDDLDARVHLQASKVQVVIPGTDPTVRASAAIFKTHPSRAIRDLVVPSVVHFAYGRHSVLTLVGRRTGSVNKASTSEDNPNPQIQLHDYYQSTSSTLVSTIIIRDIVGIHAWCMSSSDFVPDGYDYCSPGNRYCELEFPNITRMTDPRISNPAIILPPPNFELSQTIESILSDTQSFDSHLKSLVLSRTDLEICLKEQDDALDEGDLLNDLLEDVVHKYDFSNPRKMVALLDSDPYDWYDLMNSHSNHFRIVLMEQDKAVCCA